MAPVLSREDALRSYIEGHIVSRWSWGGVDCVFFAINWVRAFTGIDPAKRLRGSYSDESGAEAVMEREGGFLAMVKREMSANGFLETPEPVDGDVAIVRAPISETALDMVMVIRSRGRWVGKTARGIRAGQWQVVCAWKIP